MHAHAHMFAMHVKKHPIRHSAWVHSDVAGVTTVPESPEPNLQCSLRGLKGPRPCVGTLQGFRQGFATASTVVPKTDLFGRASVSVLA